MGEEEVKNAPNYVSCVKTLLVEGREQYKNDKPLKRFIIIKCMATLFSVLPYNSVTRRRRGQEKG